MSSAGRIIGRLKAEISALPLSEYGEVILDDDRFDEPLEPSVFLEPEPDVLDAREHPQIARDCAEHATLLGVYIPMSSPGSILLNERNLRRFYWSLINRLRRGLPYLFPLDLDGTLDLVILKTYQHDHRRGSREGLGHFDQIIGMSSIRRLR